MSQGTLWGRLNLTRTEEGFLDRLPSVSVIIPSYNRDASLVECLTSVIHQDYAGDMEIIVVDQTRVHSPEVTDFFRCHHEKIFRIVQEEPSSPKARNTGAAIAKNELLIFVDDDMVLPSYAIARFAGYFDCRDGCAVAGLPVSDHAPELSLAGYARLYGEGIRDLNAGPIEHSYYIPCPFCIRAELYRSLGGFDENLRRLSPQAYGEDDEIWYRAGRAGVKLLIDPGIRVTHRDHLSGGCDSRRTDARLARIYHMRSMAYIRIKHHGRMGVQGWLQMVRGYIANRHILLENPKQVFRNLTTARAAVKQAKAFMAEAGDGCDTEFAIATKAQGTSGT